MLTTKDMRAWLADEIHVDVSKLDDDTPLFSSGLLDSFTMVEVVALIEDKTGRKMSALEVSPENIDTINCLVAWVRGEGPGVGAK